MNEPKVSRDRFPYTIVASALAGLTSGVVTATLMSPSTLPTETSSRAPVLQGQAPSVSDTKELLGAIRELTAALERTSLRAPDRSRTAISSESTAEAQPDSLEATLRSLDETLKGWGRAPSLAPKGPAPLINEAVRAQGVHANELAALATTFRDQPLETSRRALSLRSIDYMVHRFGMPTEINAGQGSIFATWRTESASLQATFVDGVVVSTEARAR